MDGASVSDRQQTLPLIVVEFAAQGDRPIEPIDHPAPAGQPLVVGALGAVLGVDAIVGHRHLDPIERKALSLSLIHI